MVSWRWGVAVLGVLSLLGAWATTRLPSATRSRRGLRAGCVSGRIVGLAGFTLVLGLGMAPVNTFLALYGSERLDLAPPVAAWLVAVMGAAGHRRAGHVEPVANSSPDPVRVLPRLAVRCGLRCRPGCGGRGRALAGVAGAIGLGIFAVAGYAVAMVAVMHAAPEKVDGRAAALVAAGFFGGFAVGPPVAGLLAQHVGYAWMWCAVALVFLAASLVGGTLADPRNTRS